MKITTLILLSLAGLVMTSCQQRPDPISECIKLPPTSTANEKSASVKLSAALIAQIGSPALETSFSSKVNQAFAALSQKSLDQLVLIEFLVCLKTHHPEAWTPAMDASLLAAVRQATGSQSGGQKLSGGSKEMLGGTRFGVEKLAALRALGH
jgi:hypothetical protein